MSCATKARAALCGSSLLLACGGAQPQSAPPDVASTTAVQASNDPDRAQHMQQTFWMVVEARNAVIDGDLPAARAAAQRLVASDFDRRFPSAWARWVTQLQAQAESVAQADTLDAAARGIGALGVTCGDCHFEHQAGPDKVRTAPEPWSDTPDDIGQRMLRHEVAAEQMWAGLYVPSEHAWRDGTITLRLTSSRAPIHEDGEDDARLTQDALAIRDVAQRARVATTYAALRRAQSALKTCSRRASWQRRDDHTGWRRRRGGTVKPRCCASQRKTSSDDSIPTKAPALSVMTMRCTAS